MGVVADAKKLVSSVAEPKMQAPPSFHTPEFVEAPEAQARSRVAALAAVDFISYHPAVKVPPLAMWMALPLSAVTKLCDDAVTVQGFEVPFVVAKSEAPACAPFCKV